MARGRKRKNDLYFGPTQEQAVVDFLASDDFIIRNEIYNKHLREPLNKMVESIIRKYKLYRKGISFEELHSDTLSFLITKSDKFEGSRGKKAYSYYGTICKNHLLGLLDKDKKILESHSSYEDISSSLEENEDFIYEMEKPLGNLEDLIKDISDEIKELLSSNDFELKKKLTDNEKKVGMVLVHLLENWEAVFENLSGSNKYHKDSFLWSIRQATNLDTKEIRVAMKRYKKLYNILKQDRIDDGYL